MKTCITMILAIPLAGILAQGCKAKQSSQGHRLAFFDSTFRACQSLSDIENRVSAEKPNHLEFNKFGYARVVADIDNRFCIHNVGKNQVGAEENLQVAIADLSPSSRLYRTTFIEAQWICQSLTLNGKRWSAPKSLNETAIPRETTPGRSLETIGAYFYAMGERRFFWSGSGDSSNDGNAWEFDIRVGRSALNTTTSNENAVRCVALP